MVESIFDNLTDVYHAINSFEWHPALGVEPENFSNMPIKEKAFFCAEILRKIECLLNNTADTLISWSWWEKHLHCTFEEWLQFQMAKFQAETYHRKNGRIVNKSKRLMQKVRGLRL